MHGFVHAQALDIRPLEHLPLLAGHLVRIENRGELHKFRLAGGIDALDQFAQREANPRHDDRPSFHTSMAVDTLFRTRHLEDRVEIEVLFLLHQAIDLYLPRTRAEILGEFCGPVLVSGEFVIVVVGGDVFVGSDGFRSAERALLDAVNLVSGPRCGRRRDDFAEPKTRDRCGSGERRTCEKLAPGEIQTSRCNFRGTNVFRFLDKHENPYDPRPDSACFYLPPDRTLARRKSCKTLVPKSEV